MADSLKVDINGNIFAAAPGGLFVLAPDGTLLGRFDLGTATGNCAWGEDGSSLFITSNTIVYRIRLATKGSGTTVDGIRFTFPDGTMRIREAKAGEVFFGEALIHASENIGDTDAHGLPVEMKALAKGNASASMTNESELLTAITFIRGMEGSEEDLMRELLSTTVPTRAEPGNLRYDLYQSPTNKDYFMRLEVWRNPQALEDHKQTPHLKASFERRKNKGFMTEITTWRRVRD